MGSGSSAQETSVLSPRAIHTGCLAGILGWMIATPAVGVLLTQKVPWREEGPRSPRRSRRSLWQSWVPAGLCVWVSFAAITKGSLKRLHCEIPHKLEARLTRYC